MNLLLTLRFGHLFWTAIVMSNVTVWRACSKKKKKKIDLAKLGVNCSENWQKIRLTDSSDLQWENYPSINTAGKQIISLMTFYLLSMALQV